MEQEYGQAAERLRAARERLGISQRELARRVDLSPSLISQIETGKSMPSVSTLLAIVNELGISMDAVFRDGENSEDPVSARESVIAPADGASERKASAGRIVQREDSREVIHLESGVRWERLTRTTDPLVDFLYVVYDVGGASSLDGTLMRHQGREYLYIIRGRLGAQVGFDKHELGPGDSMAFDSSIPHWFENLGDEPLIGIWCNVGRYADPETD